MKVTPDFTVRKYQPSDYPEFEQMVFALYEEDDYGMTMTSEKVFRTVQELGTVNNRGSIFIFTAEEEIVGYAILIHYWSNEYGGHLVSIDEMYVKESWRNRGIGGSFIKLLETNAPEKTVGMSLEVAPENEKAIRFYQRMGFKKSGNTGMVRVV